MSNDNVTPIHTIETEKTSRSQKIKTFAKKNKTPFLLTVTAVSGLAAGYFLRVKSDEILEETRDLLESTNEKLENVAESINDQIEEK